MRCNATDTLFPAVESFTRDSSVLFLGTAKRIREISLKERDCEGSGEASSQFIRIAGTVVGGIVGTVLGPASIGPGAEIGTTFGDFVNKGINKVLQRIERADFKALHKRFFEGLEQPYWEKSSSNTVQEFFYDVYQNYNVQFRGMLGNGSDDILVDSIENATRKLALDIVHRIITYMTKEAKKDTQRHGLFTRDDLINGLIKGESSGKPLDKVLSFVGLAQGQSGGTIKLKTGQEFHTAYLIKKPFEIVNDGDVDKEETTSAQNHYYRYSFRPDRIQKEKQIQLAEKLKGSEAKIDDVYDELRVNKKRLLEEIDKTMKPLPLKLEETEARMTWNWFIFSRIVVGVAILIGIGIGVACLNARLFSSGLEGPSPALLDPEKHDLHHDGTTDQEQDQVHSSGLEGPSPTLLHPESNDHHHDGTADREQERISSEHQTPTQQPPTSKSRFFIGIILLMTTLLIWRIWSSRELLRSVISDLWMSVWDNRNLDKKTDPVSVIAVGNPGVGKSLFLNILIGAHKFKSGITIGKGLTYQLDEHESDSGEKFLDTPGLNDVAMREAAGEAISKGLKNGGVFKVLFFVSEKNGRVDPQDAATMKLVLDAAPEIWQDQISPKYGVIVNQVEDNVMEELEEKENRFEFLNTMFAGVNENQRCAYDNVAFFQKDPKLKHSRRNPEVVLPSPGDLKALSGSNLRDFVDKTVPSVKLSPEKVKEIQTNQYEQLVKKHEELAKTLEGMSEQQKKEREEFERKRNEDAQKIQQLTDDQKKDREKLIKQEENLKWQEKKQRFQAVAQLLVPPVWNWKFW